MWHRVFSRRQAILNIWTLDGRSHVFFGLSQSRFSTLHVGFVVEKVALRHAVVWVFRFEPTSHHSTNAKIYSCNRRMAAWNMADFYHSKEGYENGEVGQLEGRIL
jgi:hypothetical protein